MTPELREHTGGRDDDLRGYVLSQEGAAERQQLNVPGDELAR
jgi:hypothetical protein